jgi:hypothetical protein
MAHVSIINNKLELQIPIICLFIVQRTPLWSKQFFFQKEINPHPTR